MAANQWSHYPFYRVWEPPDHYRGKPLFKSQSDDVHIVGLQPAEKANSGIRRWSPGYLPGIFDGSLVDSVLDINQQKLKRLEL